MAKAKKIAAGLLMYRITLGAPEVFLVHPGGPFWKNKDIGTWSIPKGEADEGENDLLAVAKREYKEETGFNAAGDFKPLGTFEKPNKIVHVWAFEGDCDPALLTSNTCMIEWPPKSGKQLEIPEVDRGAFFSLEEAESKLMKYQVPVIELLKKHLNGK